MNEALFNGRARVPELHRHRGFQYGDGVFRTCLIYGSHVIDLESQVSKVEADARRLGLRPPAPGTLHREARRLAAGHRRAVLKIYLLRPGRARGYRPDPGRAVADRLLVVGRAPQYPLAWWTSGIVVERSSVRLASQPRLAGIKHLNRLEQVLAAAAASRRAAEALVSDDRGRPVEGTRSNLFWVRHGVLQTPRLDRCGVSGVMRARILQLARDLRVPARERPGSWQQLARADEVFLCNSLVGIWPVRRLGSRRWAPPGPVTRRLVDALAHPRLVGPA